MVPILLLLQLVVFYIAGSAPNAVKHAFPQTTAYPLPNPGNIAAHDPNILEHNNTFYLFKGGVHIPIFHAPSLSGPWRKLGTVLDGPTIIPKQNRTRPWAPTAVFRNGVFYCFYAVSTRGSRHSAIGVASTDAIEPGRPWTDHGALVHSGSGPLSRVHPYSRSNAIDPAFVADQESGAPYLVFGSFWDGIFQVPLARDLRAIVRKERPDARQLASMPQRKVRPVEGSFVSYAEPFYYLWFSYGKCCRFARGLPAAGEEYSIHVGRSRHVRGPFFDRQGRRLTSGGGATVYGSNHGVVYAPGGLGVLAGNGSRRDILYFHYLNTTVGLADKNARLGWTYLDYVDGWPFANATDAADSEPELPVTYTFNLLVIMWIWAYLWLDDLL
ncbi:Arabinan endo-1,5-alpha-L-arabinosidase [Aspergillus sp. HF37]|nr:Arabinan endo-1,5-alpha-L-arabinosidase [Aspergillus sp. HF37]